MQFLPEIFDKITELTIPPVGIDNKWFGVNFTDTKISIPTTAANDCKVILMANGTEPVLRISTSKLPIEISSDWNMHFSILKHNGNILADFVDEDFTLDIQLSTMLNA